MGARLDKLRGMTNRSNWLTLTSLLAALVAVTPACKKEEKKPAEETPAAAEPAAQTPPAAEPATPPAGEPPPAGAPGAAGAGATAVAVAELKPASKSEVSGTVTLSEKDGKVEVEVDLKGLRPGDHGFHIHEKGDCSSPDALSAGGHFNPDKKEHGAPDAPAHHAGDLGNLTVGADGTVKTTVTVDFLTLGDAPNSAVGKAVIVHEKPDDLKSQPVGNAGGRVACGVVEKK